MTWDDWKTEGDRSRGSELSFDRINKILEGSGLLSEVRVVKVGGDKLGFVIRQDTKTLSEAFIRVGRQLTQKLTDLASDRAYGRMDYDDYEAKMETVLRRQRAITALAHRIVAESAEGRVFLKKPGGVAVRFTLREVPIAGKVVGFAPTNG